MEPIIIDQIVEKYGVLGAFVVYLIWEKRTFQTKILNTIGSLEKTVGELTSFLKGRL